MRNIPLTTYQMHHRSICNHNWPAQAPGPSSSYAAPRMPRPTEETHHMELIEENTASGPQFYIMLSGSFSASKTVFARRIFSNKSHPCEALSPAIHEMLEEDIHSQIVNLMDRKFHDSLQLAAQTSQLVDEEYRISFFIGTLRGMSETKCYLSRQTLLLCSEEAREITTCLETIVARQIAIFDPPTAPENMQIVDTLDSRPLVLTLRFDICDASQKILVTRLVSCTTPTYPLPPSDEVRSLMQKIWKNAYEIVKREKLSKRDSARLSADEREMAPRYKFCVSFDVLFGDADHKWFGGLCYGSRAAEFSDYTLGRLTGKVAGAIKEQLAIFEVLGSLRWPEGRKMEPEFITTDGLEEAR